MQMTEGEIKTNVLQAKDQRAQIKICAELNAVDEEEIKSILRTQGVDLRALKGANDGSKASRARRQAIPYKKPEIIPEPPKSSEPAARFVWMTVSEAMAALRAELDEINRQQYALDMRKAELYQQIWDMLGEM